VRTLTALAAILLAGALAVVPASPARAHGADHTVVHRTLDTDGVAIAFFLSTGEAVDLASYRLFAPGEDGVAFQEGRTDRLGRVLFVPDRPGSWRIDLKDVNGHGADVRIEVGADLVAPPEPAWRRWLLRFSLLANLFLIPLVIFLLQRTRSEKPQAAPDHRPAPPARGAVPVRAVD
jgi:hypothetical protein